MQVTIDVNKKYKENIENSSDGRKLILSKLILLLRLKNEKVGIRLERNICQKKEDKFG